jgi:adenylosuccinate lyase
MPDYQEIIDSAEEQLLANIKQAQELNLAAVGVMRALAQFAVPPQAEELVGRANAQAAAAGDRGLNFTSKLMELQRDYAARLLAEVGAPPEKT